MKKQTKETTMKMVRQGDVLIERVQTTPKNLTLQKGRPILAHGEATGHAHEIADGSASRLSDVNERWIEPTDLEDSWPMTQKVLELSKDSSVVHQEHAPIPLEKGTYRVTRQREYSPEAIRNVAD